jgi:pantetheine-phosphate adenylyltransferase
VAVFPGSFDPITRGHLDIIHRGAAIFDTLVVAISENPQKTPLLPVRWREEVLQQTLRGIPNVRVRTYSGLTVDFCRRVGAVAILRGIRDASDLHAELQMAATNRAVSGIETILLPSDPRYAFLSSTLIRQIALGGGDVSALVPPEVLASLRLAKPKAPPPAKRRGK